jgi:hypothetical protein
MVCVGNMIVWVALYSHIFSVFIGSLPVSEPTSTASVDLARPSLKNALIAEFFGTAILVQVGCGGLCVSLYLGNMASHYCECCLVFVLITTFLQIYFIILPHLLRVECFK